MTPDRLQIISTPYMGMPVAKARGEAVPHGMGLHFENNFAM